MATAPDNLENLLNEIQRTIGANRRFLQALMDETGSKEVSDEGEEDSDEEFEEL